MGYAVSMGFLSLFRICQTSANVNAIGLTVVVVFLNNMGVVGTEKKKMLSEEGTTEVDERMEERRYKRRGNDSIAVK